MDRLALLENFFNEVADLTIRHEEWKGSAVVFPNDLGMALSKVDPEWYRKWKERKHA